ncbi:hypothetical protein VPH35_068427 [Triticum aestivum]
MPCLVPAPPPVWGSQCRSLNSFFPNLDNPGFFDHAVPLVSRHGLLLVRLDVHSVGVRSVVFNRELLAVCNLVTGTFDVLPWLIHSFGVNLDETGYAILTAMDCSSFNDDADDDEQDQQLSLFKMEHVNTCSGYVGGGITSKALKQHNVVVCRGMAHWLFEKASSFYTLDVGAKTGQAFFTEVSIQLCGAEYDGLYLSANKEGRLTLLQLRRDGLQLKTWRLHDNGGLIDMNPQVFSLKHPNQQEIHGVVYTYLGETSGTLLMKDNYGHVYAADVKTGVMHEVTGWPRRSNMSRKKTVPLEMDWLSAWYC